MNALKHGVSPGDAIQAAERSLWIEPVDVTPMAVPSLMQHLRVLESAGRRRSTVASAP